MQYRNIKTKFIQLLLITTLIINQAKCCDSDCDSCNNWGCITCKPGYYNVLGSCQNCRSNCETCTWSNNCQKCFGGYYVNSNVCYACTKPCVNCLSSNTNCSSCVDTTNQVTPTCACKEGKIMNTSTYYCDNCPNNCKICSSTSVCTQCYDGYLLSGTVCISCTKPCVTCSTSVTSCDTCIDTSKQTPSLCDCIPGYIMNTSNYLCEQCTYPCSTCQTSVTNCQTCATTYTINSGTCSCQNNQFELNTTPTTCENCTNPCQTCSTSATNCNSCITGLNRHLSSNQCICDDGFYENIICQPCQLPCINCTSASVCTSCNDPTLQQLTSCTCQQTYYMDNSFICQSCITPCQNCNSLTLCTSCIDNYYISGNTCIQCVLPCYNCIDLSNKCTSCANPNQTISNDTCICDDGYYMDNALLCQPCNHPCSKCQTNPNYCTDCSSTYVMSTTLPNTCECPSSYYEVLTNSPTDCQVCTQPCDNCFGTAVHCLSCIDSNQTVNSSNQCECKSGYLMTGVNCISCVNPCIQCSGNTAFCTQCKDSQHYINNGSCICNPGWINNNNYDCIACQNPCATCSINNTHCDSCLDTNHLINPSFECICKDTFYSDTINTCAACILPCKTCEINQDHCLTCIDSNQSQINNICICNDGYFDVSNYCQQCQHPCIKCEISNDHCLECLDQNHDLINNKCICKFGYGSSGTGGINCSQCKYPCLDCSTSVNTCKSCIDSGLYHLQDNECLCQSGYFQIETQCQKCSPQCSSCTDQSDLCLKCSDLNHDFIQNSCICKYGYYTDIQMQCSKCQLPCVTCVINYDHCTSCYDDNQSIINGKCICDNGYYMSGFQCKQCNKVCRRCNSNTECIECKDEYYLLNTKCLKCEIPCQTCLDIITCITCTEYYYMNEIGLCAQCISNCKYCNDSTNCINCQDQFYYDNQSCIPCYNKCKSCENNPYFCTSCIDKNQQLIDNQCICKDGYYEENFICKSCYETCKICYSLSFCTECKSIENILLVNNQCICKDGYYENNLKCLLCDLKCLTCLQNADNCQSCNELQNRILKQNKCICQKGYFQNENSECWSCNSNEGKIIKDCQYQDCTDHVWTYGEDCDDGNNITRDGCSNCKIDNNYSCLNSLLEPSLCFQCNLNCLQCQLNQIKKLSECIKCNQGFFLFNSICAKCSEKCLTCETNASNCKSCRFLQNKLGECQLCESQNGLYSDQINNKCYSKCGDSFKSSDEECDDGNLLSGDGCDLNCKKEKKFICKDGICITPEYPIPYLFSFGDNSLYQNIRQFKLTYNLFLNLTSNDSIENELIPYIKNEIQENLINCPYQKLPKYQFDNQSNVNFSIIFELTFNRSTKNELLIIKYQNISKFVSYQGYFQQESQIQVLIPEYIFIEESSVIQVQMATNGNSYVLYVIGVMCGGAILFGGLDIFYNLLDTIQMLSYLKYINTQLPYNLQEFFDFFGFAQLNFISKYLNLQKLIDPYITYEQLKPIPPKIRKDDLNSLLIINGSSIFVVWLSLLGIYVLSTFIPSILQKIQFKYYTEIPGTQDFTLKFKLMFLAAKIFIIKLCYIVVSEFFYSGIFRTLIATAYDYSFSLTLQLYALEFNSKEILVNLSSYLAIMAFGIYLFTIYILIKISGASSLNLEQYQNKMKYGSLFEGIKKDNFSKYFNAIILIKKLLFMLNLIFCYFSPFYQVINLTLLSFLHTILLILFKPLDDQKEYIKQLSCEINTTSALIFISSLVLDQEVQYFSEDLRSKIGWFCIANISLIFAIQLMIDAIQQWMLLIKKYKQLKRLVEKINQLFHSRPPQQTNHNIFIRTDSPNE